MATQELRFIGDQIFYPVGRVVIGLQWVRDGAYAVTTYQGTMRIEEHCKAWPTDDEARGYARLLVAHYRAMQDMGALCGCRGVGWIPLDRTWAPCFTCNSGGERIPAPPVPAG